jgi:aryl-alcohol dehydrogenase-like predicted oxidoreductase
MDYRPLGGSGFHVSSIALGCGNFGGIGSAPAFFGQGETKEDAFRLLDAAREMGITLLDTADAYGGGRSESWIGEWMAGRSSLRDEVVVATKVFNSVEGDPNDHGLKPDRIRRQIDGSLRRLRVPRVDLYLIHQPDPDTPIAETLGALDDLVHSGKVGAIGASNVTGALLREALGASADAGLARFEWVQNAYSLLDREPERDVLPLCASLGLGFTPFSPLSGGWLTGKYRRGEEAPRGSRMTLRPEPYLHLRDLGVFDALDRFANAAAERGVSMPGLALAWLLAQPQVTSIVIGPRLPSHLDPVREALSLRLTAAEASELSATFQNVLSGSDVERRRLLRVEADKGVEP